MKILVWIINLSLLVYTTNAQPASDSLNYPRIGRPCPDFALRNIKYFSKDQATLSDFKGKWLLLSFWNKFCPGCIASFPRENRWHEKYAEKLQFISVAIQDKEGEIGSMFKRYRQRENLTFPITFDSLLANKWQIFAGPYFILIDPDGIVKARCYLPETVLEQFMEGGAPIIPPYDKFAHYDFEKDQRREFDESKPFLVDDNGGKDGQFSYRSMISEFACTTQLSKEITDEAQIKNTGQFSLIGQPLFILYNYAFYGSKWPPEGFEAAPIIDVKSKDSMLFKYTSFGYDVCENAFSYNLNMPSSKISLEKVMKIMQQDLGNYFGFRATIEERKFPGWKLVAVNEAKEKLKSRGGKSQVRTTSETEDYFARNIPWSQFVNDFKRNSGFRKLIDSTGISGNTDIKLHCSFFVKSEVLTALKANGLDLVPIEITKKALVIKGEE